MKQQFSLNDGRRPELYVVGQKSFKYDAMSIQISKVLDLDHVTIGKEAASVPYKWIYEEIDNSDFVIYARFMDEVNIKNNYPWSKEMW
jgi:hypothetical protein